MVQLIQRNRKYFSFGGIGISGAALVSAKVVSDTFQNSGNSKPFSCQRTQIVDLALNVGGALVKERDTIIMSSIANGSAWNVAEYFTNGAGSTSLTSYQWQSVPPAPAGPGSLL